MKKNLYYQEIYARENIIQHYVFKFFMGMSSYPRLLIEVFTRKNFGERYFSLVSAISVFVFLAYFPFLSGKISSIFGGYPRTGRYHYSSEDNIQWEFWKRYAGYYLFLLLFLFVSFKRWMEVRRNPSVFDFERFSLYSGKINPLFFDFPVWGNKPNLRMVEIFLEPGAFFVLGLLLSSLGQSLGTLLIIVGIITSIAKAGAYKKGDDMIMDIIDQMILNRELENAFVNDVSAEEAEGVRFYGERPANPEHRQMVAEALLMGDNQTSMAV